MATATELLDLSAGVSQRTEGARFELRDVAGAVLGSVTPQRVVSLTNAVDGSKRSVDNFVLTPDVQADVNPLTDRVAAFWRLSTGHEDPLGVFLFASWSAVRRSYGLTVSSRLLDQSLILGQPSPTTVGFSVGVRVIDALAGVFDRAGIHTYSIDPSNVAILNAPLGWAAGTDTYASMASYLCNLAGLNDWYFNNVGLLTVARKTDITLTAALRYEAGRNIIAGSAVEQNDILNAPNRYLAIDSASRDTPVFGSYDLPNSAPNSIANRGFVITKTVDAPGVGSFDAAAAFAQTYAQTDPRNYETVTFSGPPDPRHDTYDVVEYLGVNYQEKAWRLTCAPGGPHQHALSRKY